LLRIYVFHLGQESFKERLTAMHSSASFGATPAQRSAKHPQTRRVAILQSPSARPESTQTVRNERRFEEDSRDQNRVWLVSS